MNRTVELESKSAELISDIQDVLHAASLNLKAICAQTAQQPLLSIHEEFFYTERLLQSLKRLVQCRSDHFLGYMITRQIQDEEGRVRRQRLNEYEEKIYDQKRIIADKETFFQNLLRPKRKRPSSLTPEEFMESRARERETQQRTKADQIVREMMELQTMRRHIEEQEKNRKRAELQSTKSSSLQVQNFTGVDMAEIATERVVTLQERGNKENRPGHTRTTSMQHTVTKQSLGSKREDSEVDAAQARNLLQNIHRLNAENQVLHNVYDQQINSYKFKQSQRARLQGDYMQAVEELKIVRERRLAQGREDNWRYKRVGCPIAVDRRADSK